MSLKRKNNKTTNPKTIKQRHKTDPRFTYQNRS